MATYNLGRILPIFRGAWSPTKTYDKLDVVTFEGSSYMAISDNTNKRPDENPSDWILSAAKGEPGEPGKDGPTYKPGVGISIINDVISATGGGEGGGFYFGGFGVEIDENTNSINAEVRAENDMPTSWQLVTMTGLPLDVAEDFESKNVFHYKGKTYYSAGLNKNYVLDVLSWEKVEWVGVEIYGEDIFVDAKGDMYYFHGNQYMKYDEDLESWPPVSINITNAFGRYMFVGKNGYSYYSENRNKTYKIKAGNITTWEKVTVNQDCPATFIWEDETSTYYSNGATHFFYDYENDRWRTQRWTGVNALFGNQIWKQGSHIFFSANSGATYVKKESKWEFVYSLSNLSGDYVFADGENVFSYVDNRAMQLVIPKPFYVTRHGDKLATEEFVLEHAGKINEGFGITAEEEKDGSVTVSTVVDKGDGISFNEWKKIADSIKLQDSEGNITVMDPDNIINIFNWKGDTFLLISGTMYKFNENVLTFVYQSESEYQISGRDVYIINNNLHISNGTAQYVYSDTTQRWVVYAGWDQFQYLGYVHSARLCSNGSEIVCLKPENVSSNFPYTLYYKDRQWTVIDNDVFVNAYVNIWADSTGYFYNQKYKFVNKQWILDNNRFNVDDVKRVWTDHENHTFYDANIFIDGKKYNYDWIDLPSMNGRRVFKTLYGTYIYTSAGVYALRKETLVDNHGKTYMNEFDVRYLIECQLGNIYTKLRSI